MTPQEIQELHPKCLTCGWRVVLEHNEPDVCRNPLGADISMFIYPNEYCSNHTELQPKENEG